MSQADRKNILISGAPGSGKTTLVRTIAHHLQDLNPAGFYTAEMRTGGVRQGFELVSLCGERKTLAHVRIKSPQRVGKYGVDVAGFEDFLALLPPLDFRCSLFIIDEIGRMETLSARFCTMISDVLASDIPCIATIAHKGDHWIEEIKLRNDVEIITLNKENRASCADRIIPRVTTLVKGRR